MSSPFDLTLASALDATRSIDAGLQVWEGWRLTREQRSQRRAQRLDALLGHARQHSAFYRALYASLPTSGPIALATIPSVDKRALMADFDRVSTRREVNRRAVEQFVSDPRRHGALFEGRYAVWTSSGTTGQPGWFVHDREALAVYDALEAQRFLGVGLLRSWLPGERYAMVAATGGHFAGVSSIERTRRAYPWLAPFMRSCALLQPLSQLVAELNAYAPAILATYPTAAEMLAEEQASGRLHLRLRELWTGGECLAPATRERLQGVFGCAVRSSYGASEFLPIAWECRHRRLHVNDDWCILEPVDGQGASVPPGQRSHSVLLTNLANRVQPLIRYDLGDSITLQPTPCACGSDFPTIVVEGRCDDSLQMPLARGGTGVVVPLALATVLEEEARVHDFQVVQTAPRSLEVRLGGEEVAARQAVRRALGAYFHAMGFSEVKVEVTAGGPRRDEVSGKLRRVVRAL